MEAGTIRQEIEFKNQELEFLKDKILQTTEARADALVSYKKAKSLQILKLKNGVIDKWEGQDVGKIAISAAVSIADGMIYTELFELELRDGEYKGLMTTIGVVKSQLNGLQSLNKFHE